MYRFLAAGALILTLIVGVWGAVQKYKAVVAERDTARAQLDICQSSNDALADTISEFEREAERAIAESEAAAARADEIEAARERDRTEAARRFDQLRRTSLSPDECAAQRVPDDRLRVLDAAADS